jgi:hypothetical protein
VDRLHERIEGFNPRVFVRVRAERRRRNGVGAQCVGADSEPELGVRSSGQDQHDASKERARCGRQRHLQTTGSARWPALKRRRVCAAARRGTAGDTHTASAQGSVQPRLEGRVHNKVKGETHLAFLDTTARRQCRVRRGGCRAGTVADRLGQKE